MPKTSVKSSKKEVLFQPKYSVKLQDFIVDKIEEGMTLAEVCRNYSTVVPIEKSLYRWKKKYPAFKIAIDEAYQTLIFKMMDEMNDLSKEIRDLDKEWDKLSDSLTGDETSREIAGMSSLLSSKLRDKRDSAKVRLKALEFMLTRIAPKLVPELKETSHSMQVSIPSINIVNYSPPPKEEQEFRRIEKT